jgi:hypothetical protein
MDGDFDFEMWASQDQARLDGMMVDFRAVWSRMGAEERVRLHDWLIRVDRLSREFEKLHQLSVLGWGALDLQVRLQGSPIGPQFGLAPDCHHVIWPRVLLRAVEHWMSGRPFTPDDYVCALMEPQE